MSTCSLDLFSYILKSALIMRGFKTIPGHNWYWNILTMQSMLAAILVGLKVCNYLSVELMSRLNAITDYIEINFT